MIVDLAERKRKLREFFSLAESARLEADDQAAFELSERAAEGLGHFDIEWQIIPAEDALPLDDSYFSRLYPAASRDFRRPHAHGPSYRERLIAGHRQHQGRIIGVEAIQKPGYLPEKRQFYGSRYGIDARADPFAAYMGRAGMMNGTRYDHNYLALREFVKVVTEDWRSRQLLPAGYRVTVCPPGVFNLIGNVFHPEWSGTETLELGFYRDREGNATCYAVGSNGPGDFSYIEEIEGEDWSLMGFRVALVPE
jgi:hypothetical protein